MLIALEGIDGSGTTTQAEALKSQLEERGLTVYRTAEPSTGPVGKLIRRVLGRELEIDADALALLFASDRLDHLERELEPALERHDLVLTDRYLLSSLAYQALSTPLDFVRRINARARRPDASVLLRIDAEQAAERRAARGGPEEHFDALETQRAIATAYDAAATLDDVGPVYIVDAGLDADAVTAALRDIVLPLVEGKTRG